MKEITHSLVGDMDENVSYARHEFYKRKHIYMETMQGYLRHVMDCDGDCIDFHRNAVEDFTYGRTFVKVERIDGGIYFRDDEGKLINMNNVDFILLMNLYDAVELTLYCKLEDGDSNSSED